jgi:hypothetical protein
MTYQCFFNSLIIFAIIFLFSNMITHAMQQDMLVNMYVICFEMFMYMYVCI